MCFGPSTQGAGTKTHSQIQILLASHFDKIYATLCLQAEFKNAATIINVHHFTGYGVTALGNEEMIFVWGPGDGIAPMVLPQVAGIATSQYVKVRIQTHYDNPNQISGRSTPKFVLDLGRAPYVLYGVEYIYLVSPAPFSGPSIPNSYIAPLFFKMACK